MMVDRRKAIYLIPLQDIVTDPDHPVNLAGLPEHEAIERIKATYIYWGTLIDVRIQEGVAVIELPDEDVDKAGVALDKIAQAAKLARPGRYQGAISLYEEALKVLPLHTGARRELAMAQVEVGEVKAAKQNLIRVLQLDPKDAWAYLGLATLANSQGDAAGALAALERLFDLPQDADTRSQEGYSRARALYADAMRRRAEQQEQAAHVTVQAALDAYTARTGTEICVR